jgi:hypothetical protein
METGNHIQQHIQLLEFTEQKIGNLAGVTPQRMGAVSTSELVGNVERAVVQSSHITEKWFEVHNHTKVRVMESLLNVAKDTYRGKTKRLQYMTDEFANVFFKLNGDEFANSEYGLFLSNSAKDNMAIEALKQLTHAALQNDKMTLSDVVQIYNASSLADLRQNLKVSEAEAQQRLQSQQQQQSELQMQQMQMQQQAEQQKLQLEIEKENREDARNADDNRTKVEIALINADSKAMDRDANDNGIRDDIDLAKLQLEREKLNQKTTETQDKMKLERDKLTSKEQIEKAKINKPDKKV